MSDAARTCEACGESLEGRRRGARFCSSSCRTRAFKSRAKGTSTPEPEETFPSVPMEPERLPARRNGSYSEPEVDAGLTALVVCSGNSRRAERLLVESGYRRVPDRTLHDWKAKIHADRYLELQEDLRPELNRRMAESFDDLTQTYIEVQREALHRVRERLPEAKAAEASRIAKDAAIGSGISSEKSLLHRSQPTKIVEHRDPVEALRLLHTKFPELELPTPLAQVLEAEDRAREIRSRE